MSFFGSLLGKDSAKAAQQLGQRNAGEINAGYGQADQYAGQGYGASQARYEPYAEQGQRGNQAYGNAIGLNGQEAQQGAYQQFQEDPFLAYARQNSGNEYNAIFKRYGAQGMANSGASGLAVSRAAGERANSDVNNWMNRLQGLGQQGAQIASRQAGLDQSYYGGMSDRAVGRSNALVGNDTNSTMAANNARQAGVNNLLNIFGTIVSGASRMATGGAPTPKPGV
jgi:hypothetical protein